jgi:hypothetical protein
LRRGAGVEHLGDGGVVHQSQSLALGLEARDHLPRVHSGFDQLESHAAADRVFLLGQPDLAHAAFSDFLKQVVAADCMAAERFVDCIAGYGLYRRPFQETA